MVKIDIPRVISRKTKSGGYVTREYIIYKNSRDDDVCGDFHLQDFIGVWSIGHRKKYNKKSMKYYNTYTRNYSEHKSKIDYDWFMSEIEKHFRQFDDIEVESGVYDSWYGKYEYILLKFEEE